MIEGPYDRKRTFMFFSPNRTVMEKNSLRQWRAMQERSGEKQSTYCHGPRAA
jgi:hypothetical protein